MTRFEGGPDGEVLMLRAGEHLRCWIFNPDLCAPKLLRVVISPYGKIDALDQLDDEPKPREKVFVYERVGAAGATTPNEPWYVHIKMSPRSELAPTGRALPVLSSGYYAQVIYRFIDEQPQVRAKLNRLSAVTCAAEMLRETRNWREWALDFEAHHA